MKHILIAIAITALALPGCANLTNEDREAIRYWGGVAIDTYLKYRAVKDEQQTERERREAIEWQDRLRMGRVIMEADAYRQAHPQATNQDVLSAAQRWYYAEYGETLTQLLTRMFGPSQDDRQSDADILISILDERL